MTITRQSRVVAVAAIATFSALALSACGSDNNTSTGADPNGPAPSASGSFAGLACGAGTMKASGSSAQANAMSQWISDYQQGCTGATIEYAPTGSGAGITDFINDAVAFGGSDAAISGDDLTNANTRCGTGNTAINIPMVVGPVAIAYNVSGVSNLVLTPDVIAKIFAGAITKWNDPAIAALNPSASLPAASIAQFHRADSSGTTANFGAYLTAAAPSDWTYGNGKDWVSPAGLGSTGSDGVASSVSSTDNSIGYMEWSFAKNANLAIAEIDNGGGPVALTAATVGKDVETAKVVGTGQDLTLQLDYATTVKGAYPLVLVTYEIACTSGNDISTLPLLKSFLGYAASAQGQGQLAAQYYVPLPKALDTKVAKTVSSLG